MLQVYFKRYLLLCLLALFGVAYAQTLATIEINEPVGLDRDLEYVEIQIQIANDLLPEKHVDFYVQSAADAKQTACQLVSKIHFPAENVVSLRLIFPVVLKAFQHKVIQLKYSQESLEIPKDLIVSGDKINLVVENSFYKADLTKSNQSEGKNHDSGQLRELFLKQNFNVLLSRAGNRIHWAPNFQKKEHDHYSTIAGWDNPDYHLINGPYLVFTQRKGPAPNHPEIFLTARYFFYAALPYFKFYSSIEMVQNVWLTLLRNDEMTMDSLFTNVAYKKKSGEILDLTFSQRYEILKADPIENDAPWLCFYNREKGYAFGSIRLKYDNSDKNSFPSPTYQAHTKISDGAGGGKYWNRRLIHEYPTFVPAGSKYVEENAYLVFKIQPNDPLKEIKYRAGCLRNPLRIKISY